MITTLTARRALGSLALLLAVSLASGAPEGPETRYHDVADLVSAGSTALSTPHGSFLLRAPASHEYFEELPELEESWDGGVAADDLENLLGALASEADDEWGSVDQSRGLVSVTGNAEAQRRVAGALELVRRSLGDPIRVGVEVLRLPAGTEVPRHPDAAALAAFRAADADGSTRAVELAIDGDRWHVADSIRSRGVLFDVDVEIAQEAQIGDPVVTAVDDGLRVRMRAAALTDGRAAVRVMVASGDLALPLRRLQLGPEELGSLELPEIDAVFASTELVLSAGRPVAMALRRPEGDVHALVLSLRAPAYSAIGGALRLLPVGGFARDSFAARIAMGGGPVFGDGTWMAVEALDLNVGRLDRDVVFEEIFLAIETQLEQGTCILEAMEGLRAPSVLLRGPATDLDRATDRLAEIERMAFRHARLDVRFEERGGAEPAREVGRLILDAPLGVPVAAAAYRQISYVMDNDVEVAQTARIADPTVGVATAGLFVNATVSAAGERRSTVVLELRASDISAPAPMISGAKHASLMERVVEAVANASGRVMVPVGGTGEIALGRSPFSGSPRRLVAVVRVTR